MALLIILLLALLVLPIVAVVRASQAKSAVKDLEAEIARLTRVVAGLEQGRSAAAAPAREDATPDPVSRPALEVAGRAVPAAAAWPVMETERVETSESEPSRSFADLKLNFENMLTSHWLVWLGGIALALGGIFLVKYSIDQNLLSPGLRVGLGLLLAMVLAAGGEYVRRRPWTRRLDLKQPDYVPAALSAAGLFIAFAAIYAGHALYGLYSPAVTFMALAAVAGLAIGFSLLQGPFIAALGLVGGYLVPMLVPSEESNALALFLYVFVITGAGLGVIRYRAWGWLLWLAILGSTGWVFLWFLAAWQPGDALIIALYLPATALLLTFGRPLLSAPELPERPFPALALPMPERAIFAGYCAIAIAAFALVRMDQYEWRSIIAFCLLAAGAVYAARREQCFTDLPRLLGLLAVLLIGTWHLPRLVRVEQPDPLPWMMPVIPPGLTDMVAVAALLATIFALAGFWALRGARHPGHWAGLSASVPLSILVILHGRLNDFQIALDWALVSLALAGLCLLAVLYLDRRRQGTELDGAMGAYAVGTIAFLSLACAMTVREAWLTVALALQVPGIAWVTGRLRVPALHTTAGIVAGVVMVRLLANPQIYSYAVDGAVPGLNWLIYGYGIPAIGFYWAARRFRGQGAAQLATLLEAGALGFAVAFLTLEIRHLLAPDGRLDHAYDGLAEMSLLSLTWAAVGYGLLRRDGPEASPVVSWGWRIIAAIAAMHVALGHLLFANPLFTDAPVGRLPLFNLLLLAYAVPAVLALLYRRAFVRLGLARLPDLAAVAALLLAFFWITLEVRHVFQGERPGFGPTSDAEWYSYSVAWLLYGIALLALGIWRRGAALRHAALAIILLAVAKVFLFDMSTLTGILRVFSFLGLGAALVGIGFCYQRFVTPARE